MEVEGQTQSPPTNLTPIVESLLFVADGPVTVEQLARSVGVHVSDVEEALRDLASRLDAESGLRLQWQAMRVQLVTAPQSATFVERFLGLEASSRLSTAALETLALIAYRQPITRAQIEGVRGVSCDGVLRTLLHKGLVEPVGRLGQAGRPIVYGTTFEFLQYFGFTDLCELPPVEDEAVEGAQPGATA
jgi:segregation and condensation protein B